VDEEGAVTYQLAQGGGGYFTINSTTGQLVYNGVFAQHASNYSIRVPYIQLNY
jgi:hypothetical protein